MRSLLLFSVGFFAFISASAHIDIEQKILPLQKGSTPDTQLSGGRGYKGEVDSTIHSIKILSWNIYMLPPSVRNSGQELRARAIVEALKTTDYDVIVFQEAFPKKIRAIIWEGLKGAYPNDAGKPLKGGITLLNSGVWIISKHPIKLRSDKLYKECDGIDCFANKGATLVEIEKDGKTFQIVGTHMQADEGKDKQAARTAQYYDLAKLLNDYKKDGIPQIVAGDFNTPCNDSICYKNLLGVILAEDGPLSGAQQYSWDRRTNDIYGGVTDSLGFQALFDYVFLRDNGFTFTNETRIIKAPRVRWSCESMDLSDHYAIEAIFEWK